MQILWLDPFHGGSHAAVAAGYAARSAHQVHVLSLPTTGGWRWRMRGGAVTLARLVREQALRPDLIVASDMLDLATLRGLTADLLVGVPAVLYMHENQLTYPLPPGRQRDLGLAWINYTAALVADALIFNSAFHQRDFLAALPGLLGRYHDFQELHTIETLAAKSIVLAPGIDLAALDQVTPEPAPPGPPIILWNARWDYDKQPELFFAALERLAAQGCAFRLIVAGEHIDPKAPTFVAARARWADHIVHWGFAPDRASYTRLLHQADIVASAALQEFFGISLVEALYAGCWPVVPNRLNYPDLIPVAHHPACLYAGDATSLATALGKALTQAPQQPRSQWRAIATPYDWSVMAPRYDAVLADVARAATRPRGSRSPD
ncbi:MAG: tRNA-queuosine alpha-mannosyltransferase domain-containing protein [Oscillochloridaceae bacterium umkhey_bin13]